MKKLVYTVFASLVLAVLAACATVAEAKAPGNHFVKDDVVYPFAGYIGGGDCSADRATGDLYPQPDPYCIVAKGPAAVAIVAKNNDKSETNPVPPVVVTPAPPTQEPTTPPDVNPTPKPKPTKTPKPEHHDNGNHYGNDKPDSNDHDQKNKHNGEETAADHHDEDHGNKKND